MKKVPLLLTLLLLTFSLSDDAQAKAKHATRYLTASDRCEAFQSIKKRTNPGDIRLNVNTSYEIIDQNKSEPTHYRLKVSGASPLERWVAVSCGTVREDETKEVPSSKKHATRPSSSNSNAEYLLALSWQPAFCQSNQRKKECRTQHEGRYDASHFTLHGLWPQPRSKTYCNVSQGAQKTDQRGQWHSLPELELSDETYDDLSVLMPGVVSHLHRHEWIKHGSCYSLTPEEYFSESILLTEQINASAVRNFFAEHIGQTVSANEIKARFDAAFGKGAGDKVRVRCKDGLLSELWINLKGDIDEHSRIEDLLPQAPRASSSCKKGLIDPMGY